MKDENAIYYIKKISRNCFLDSQDDEKLADLYLNSPEDTRNDMLRDIAKVSETKDVAVRGAIRNMEFVIAVIISF
jgi:hypothetical protein